TRSGLEPAVVVLATLMQLMDVAPVTWPNPLNVTCVAAVPVLSNAETDSPLPPLPLGCLATIIGAVVVDGSLAQPSSGETTLTTQALPVDDTLQPLVSAVGA